MKLEDKIKKICLSLFALDLCALLCLCFYGFGIFDPVSEILIGLGILLALMHPVAAVGIKKILNNPTYGIEKIYDAMMDTEWFFDDKRVYRGIQLFK